MLWNFVTELQRSRTDIYEGLNKAISFFKGHILTQRELIIRRHFFNFKCLLLRLTLLGGSALGFDSSMSYHHVFRRGLEEINSLDGLFYEIISVMGYLGSLRLDKVVAV